MNPAFRLIEVDRVKAVIRIPAGRIAEIRPGLQAAVRVEPGGGRILRLVGTVHRIAPAADDRLFPVEIELDNREGDLREGMLADVTLFTRTHPRLFILPLEAVIERRGKRLVLLLEEGGRLVTGRFDLGRLAEPARRRISEELGGAAAPGRWNQIPEARWEALALSPRERLLARASLDRTAEPGGIGLEVLRICAIARERELPSARIDGVLCLVPDDGTLREGEQLIVRGQHRLADGAEVVLADRNELQLPGLGGGIGEER